MASKSSTRRATDHALARSAPLARSDLGILADARTALEGIATRLRSMDLPAHNGDDLARYRALDEPPAATKMRPSLAAGVKWAGSPIEALKRTRPLRGSS
jgi:hypothetical protein